MAVRDFPLAQQFTQGRTEKCVDELDRSLQRWGERMASFGLGCFTHEDVEAFPAELQEGEVTARPVHALDEGGQPLIGEDGKPVKVRATNFGTYSPQSIPSGVDEVHAMGS